MGPPPPFINLQAASSLSNQSNHTFFAFQATSALGSVGCVSKCFLGQGSSLVTRLHVCAYLNVKATNILARL